MLIRIGQRRSLRRSITRTMQAAFLESLPPSTGPSIPTHTAALHVAAKDFQTSTYNLIRSFLLISRATITTAPTYTVLIRGLLLRKQYRLASIFFTKLMRSGLPLDNPALVAGLSSLTRNGQPHLAFQVLEKYTIGPTTTPMILTTLTLNQFIVSLNRIGRPDISIRLFTHMQTLYACLPNSQTFSIILQAARLALKLDASPSTPRLRPLLPFRSKWKKGRHKKKPPRNESVDAILSALGHPSRGGLRRYVNGNYIGLDPATFARNVFDNVVSGVFSGAVAVHDFNIDPSSPPPPDEDTRHVSDIGLTILHLSRLRKKLLAPSPSAASTDGCVSGLHVLEHEDEDRQYISDIGLTMAHVRRFGFGLRPRIGAVDVVEAGEEARQRGGRETETETEGPDRSPSSSPSSYEYPSIIPTNSNFFNYIFLLCCLPNSPSSLSPIPSTMGKDSTQQGSTSQLLVCADPTTPARPPSPHLISHTFSQMRQLGIQPSNSTLAIGLVGWWDVCSPSFQSASLSPATSTNQQTEDKDQQIPIPPSTTTPPPHAYIHFVNWLRDWVGESRLPHWRTLDKWRVILGKARAAPGVGDG